MISRADDRRGTRAALLTEVARFVTRARDSSGVSRIALIGSLATPKEDPKDADVLVTVSDSADLSALAAAGRRLKGAAQSLNRGGDIFLASSRGRYLGRACHWRRCGPGIRASCRADHCGRRKFLFDDLSTVRLRDDLVKRPPLELWPTVVRRVPLPADVEEILVRACAKLAGDCPNMSA